MGINEKENSSSLQQSHFEFDKMKCFVVLALALATANAGTLQDKYANAKPGYMRIPGWQKIQSGMKKLNQKEPTGIYEPRAEHTPKSNILINLNQFNQVLLNSFLTQRPVVSLMPNPIRLLEVLKLLPMNSLGKLDYSLMDTSVVEPSFVSYLF